MRGAATFLAALFAVAKLIQVVNYIQLPAGGLPVSFFNKQWLFFRLNLTALSRRVYGHFLRRLVPYVSSRRPGKLRLPCVFPFAEFFDHFLVERRNIIGLAAGNESVVHHHFFVHPIATGIFHVGLNVLPRR